MDAKAALALVKEVGIDRLGGHDGCLCTWCEIQGVHINVCCRKSSGGVRPTGFHGTTLRVWSSGMDPDGQGLKVIAEEVARQIREHDGNAIRVRYCSSEDDLKNRCTYCHKPRANKDAYLCAECQDIKESPYYVGATLADDRDFRKYEFELTAAFD